MPRDYEVPFTTNETPSPSSKIELNSFTPVSDGNVFRTPMPEKSGEQLVIMEDGQALQEKINSLTATIPAGTEVVNAALPESELNASIVPVTLDGNEQSAITWCDLSMYPYLDKNATTSMTSLINQIFQNAVDLGIRTFKDSTPGDGAKYLIDGSDDLMIPGSLDMNMSRFVYASTWKGKVVIYDPDNTVMTYDSSTSEGASLLNKINSSSSQSKLAQSLQIDGLADDTTLNSHVCIFDSGINAYYSRSNLRTWKHICLISTRGLMSNAFYYNMTGTVSSVTAWKVKPNTTVVKLPIMDFTDKPHAINVIVRGCSRYEIWGPNVADRPLTDTGSEYVLKMENCFDCEVRNGYDVHPNVSFNGEGGTSLVSSYTLNYNYCLGCRFINQYSMGFGWGSTAGEVCSDTTFVMCRLNRIDFHEPMQGTTKVIDCDIGNNGISMCAMGRLELIRPHWKLETLNAPYSPSEVTLIKTRDDIGGWFDGDIYIENAVISGGFTYNDNNFVSSYFIGGMINMSSTNTGGVTLPDNSPVVPRLFRDITVKGVKHLRRYSTNRYVRFVYSNLPQYLKYPESITLDDFDYCCDRPLVFGFGAWRDDFYANDTTSPATSTVVPVTCSIVINRGSFAGLTFIGTNNRQNLAVKLNQVRDLRYGKAGFKLVANTRGVYQVSQSEMINGIGTIFNDTQPSAVITVQISNSIMRMTDPSATLFDADGSIFHEVSASNTLFLGDFSASEVKSMNTNMARWFKLKGCTLQTTSGGRVPFILLYSGSIGTSAVNVTACVRAGNEMVTNSVYNRLSTNDTFTLSNMSGNLGRSLYNGQVGGYFLNISSYGNCALINNATASAAGMLRTISMMP